MNPLQAWTDNGRHHTPGCAPTWNEATQLALLWGDEATPLDNQWSGLLGRLGGLGALTTMVENRAVAVAVTTRLRLGLGFNGSLVLHGQRCRLTLWRSELGFAFATGAPRRKGLASGFSIHGVDGKRAVAMELDESQDLAAFHAVALDHRSVHPMAVPTVRPSLAAARARRSAQLGPDFLQAWTQASSHSDLDRLIDLQQLDRLQAYRLLAGQGTSPFSAGAALQSLRTLVDGGQGLTVSVGRGPAALQVHCLPDKLGLKGHQAVLQAPELAVAIDMRQVAEVWQVDIGTETATEMLDETGRLLARIGSRASFEQTIRPCWTQTSTS